ncbi:10589_t:CDS:1 [Diversispora eburnea]|uniref:10589_t:CDS:1 n=1 Tax=Diversispora eburnea TaxID=1213867 RepID=A0A9N9ADJ9_9GLOM|nr:10589_t:CDS:1 [Diversispora eburnea]
MATKISTEILIMILNNVQSTQDLYSSLLVNRIWCKVTMPILWELPLGQEYRRVEKLRNKALCIRTYISCMDTQARNLLIQNGFDLSSSPPQATFDYPSFTHKLIIVNLVNFVSVYSSKINPQQIIGSDQNNIKKNNESRLLFSEICRLIINRCTFLDSFKMTGTISNNFYEIYYKNLCNYSDLIGSILKLPGAPEVFKKLESFTSTIENDDICPLYESLISICDNILNMDLSLNSYSQVQLLPKLISVQKRLENLSIAGKSYLDCNSLFRAIISQKETLKSLRLYSVNLNRVEENSSPIDQFISLQELYIVECSGLHKSGCLFLASSFTQLSSFHYFHSEDVAQKYPQEFIIKIIETSNTNLRNIYLDLYPTITFDTNWAILNHCTKITELTLLNLRPEQVIAIFNNNFDELRRFSFGCGIEMFHADGLFCQMAENVPESLETIEIIMGYENPWIFSASSLRKFFEGWCCERGGGNKNIIVIGPRLFTLSDEHFKVIEEYGVQFDIEEL